VRSQTPFLSSAAAIEKRITRAKKVLASATRLSSSRARRNFAHACQQFSVPVSAVQRGLPRSNPKAVVRVELCREAIRLATLLRDHPLASTPSTLALLALMCLHAARMPARVDESAV